MSISLSRYVLITSVVGAAASVATRQLIGRFFTINPLVPTGTVIEFSSYNDVVNFFGSGSTEAARAAFYFGWVSKAGTQAPKISFARWVSVDVAPTIYGASQAQALASWTSISAGSFGLNVGGVVVTMTGMNFTSAASLAAVAAIVQAAIRTQTGAQFTGATVTYDPVASRFIFTGGATGAATISVIAGTGGTDIAGQLGWLSASTLLSAGAVTQSITTLLTSSTNLSNNFGSFAFIPTLTTSQITEAATWNLAQNNQYMYSVPVTATNAVAVQAAVASIGGVCLTLAPLTTEFPEQCPMMILAATDYNQVNATKNYMYQIFNLTPSVTTDADANTYDPLRVNYYGQTQSAGIPTSFYQRGSMQGITGNALDMNVYANEIWLKNDAQTGFMNLLLALDKVAANIGGRSQLVTQLQATIDRALNNGAISVGKILDATQRLYVTNQTGDPSAWQKVQNLGYVADVQFVKYVDPSNITRLKATYYLVYSKSDVVYFVQGSDILI